MNASNSFLCKISGFCHGVVETFIVISEYTVLEIAEKSSQVQLSIKLPYILILLFHISGGLDSAPSHSNGAGGS
jgi:hypothetical protein